MASLTPGVLVKLLQSMDTDAKVVGEHRSAVLQVIAIVPALSASTAHDLWPSHGFYLQLSDSAYSTYVSLSDADADAILSNRPQLGQLVHVDRLHFAHPVPRASGVRPLPGRPQPFLGSPEPLVARSDPSRRGFVIQPASPADAGPPLIPSSSLRSNPFPQDNPFGEEETVSATKENTGGEKRTVFAPKENVVGAATKTFGESAAKRRFSSPAGAKLAARKSSGGGGTGEQRDPSPAVGQGKAGSRSSSPALGGAARGGSRSSSPVPSKCIVPSLVAAKEENRRVAREPSIIVPSRYRQPSPVARKAAGSPMGRRSSMSPGRRLSSGLKASPAVGEGGGGKKKVGIMVAGISKVSDALMGSVKSVRKSWDDSAVNTLVSSELKEKGGSKSKVDKGAILRTQAAISRRISDASGAQSNDEESSPNEKPKLTKKIELTSESEKSSCAIPKITVHDRKWTDGSIPLDNVSDNLAKLGKEALQRRNIASIAAAEALEEGLAIESIIRSLSMFSDLCSSSKAGNPRPTIARFLSIYDDVLKWNSIAETLAASRKNNGPSDVASIQQSKSAFIWVEAALATDLEVLHLLNNHTECLSKQKGAEKPVVPSMDPPRISMSKKNSLGNPARSHSKVLSNVTTTMWTRGYGLDETVDLAKDLRQEMQVWFLKFVEEALDVGFRLFGQCSDDGKKNACKDGGKIAEVLSQLKQINDWLDGVGRIPEETLKEKIERLKRKIYGFVISHVGSAFDSSVSLSKA
ncbi:uncharacterized protein [Elaeis guineensis]|uniref:Uncharacterized protein LOC105052338 n=1 Tax=Elaeis guineensis var. tenera TaxID=51953 RepID=A0A6I9S0S3_ELAGV|nr:uncharacterized protein LOC105052338 [Elaeis guineensis]